MTKIEVATTIRQTILKNMDRAEAISLASRNLFEEMLKRILTSNGIGKEQYSVMAPEGRAEELRMTTHILSPFEQKEAIELIEIIMFVLPDNHKQLGRKLWAILTKEPSENEFLNK